MASFVYDAALRAAFKGELNVLDTSGTATLSAILTSATYAANQTADVYLATIAAGNRLATLGALSSVTVSGQFTLDAEDLQKSALSGDAPTGLVVFVDTGSDATSLLVSYHTITPAYTPSGADVVFSIPTVGLIYKA